MWVTIEYRQGFQLQGFKLRGNRLLLKDRRIGWVTTIGDKRVFISPRSRVKHYFRIYKGWGLSEDVLEFLQRNEFDEVHIRIGKREILMSKLADWKAHGIPYQKPPFEKQVVLPEKYFKAHITTLAEMME